MYSIAKGVTVTNGPSVKSRHRYIDIDIIGRLNIIIIIIMIEERWLDQDEMKEEMMLDKMIIYDNI